MSEVPDNDCCHAVHTIQIPLPDGVVIYPPNIATRAAMPDETNLRFWDVLLPVLGTVAVTAFAGAGATDAVFGARLSHSIAR